MTHEEALAILPPEVAARDAEQARTAPVTEEQLDTLARLFGGPVAPDNGGVARVESMEPAS